MRFFWGAVCEWEGRCRVSVLNFPRKVQAVNVLLSLQYICRVWPLFVAVCLSLRVGLRFMCCGIRSYTVRQAAVMVKLHQLLVGKNKTQGHRGNTRARNAGGLRAIERKGAARRRLVRYWGEAGVSYQTLRGGQRQGTHEMPGEGGLGRGPMIWATGSDP